MSALKSLEYPLPQCPPYPLGANKPDMSVTFPVFHVLMWPYVASAAASSLHHAPTAVLMLVLVILVNCHLPY